MPAEITFVRHAETEANAAHQWQGATDTAFSSRGIAQLDLVAKRFGNGGSTLVAASDLPRALRTAQVISADAHADPRWREPNVGEWEGLNHHEIVARWPDQFAAAMRGEDVRLGGGEKMSQVRARLREAFDDLVASVGEDGSAIVVSHGLALLTLTSDLLGTKRPAPLQLMGNTAVTTLAVNSRGPQLVAYNDSDHLGERRWQDREGTNVLLIRHGETDANAQGRWQGHGDWELNDKGLAQAKRLAPAVPPVDALYSSPLARALATAEAVADHQRARIEIEPRVKEIGFGRWENLTRDEIEAADADAVARLAAGEDIVRGGTGETFSGVQDRVTDAIEEIAERHRGGTAGVVSHGGATRAFVARLLGIEFANRHRIRSMRNTALARIFFGPRGPVLAEWNAGPHLRKGEGEASWTNQRP